jgi:hypothetical protein
MDGFDHNSRLSMFGLEAFVLSVDFSDFFFDEVFLLLTDRLCCVDGSSEDN